MMRVQTDILQEEIGHRFGQNHVYAFTLTSNGSYSLRFELEVFLVFWISRCITNYFSKSAKITYNLKLRE